MYRTKVIAGVDIGTSKVTVLLGEIVEGSKLNVIGLGQSSSKGLVKGEIVDFHEASDCVHAAILAAEQQAGVQIDGVYLAQTGGHIEGFPSEASVNITAEDGRVRSEDIERASALAQGRELPENRTVIHHLRRPYKLDGRAVASPIGMEGEHLEVSYWTIHGDSRKISDSIHIINGFNLHVDDIVLSGLATSAAVATEEQKNNGTLIIDIGRGTTDYALFWNGRCMKAGCLPIGGDHISNDLSIGLRMRLKQAESLKLRYGSAVLEHRDKNEKVWLNNDFEIGDRPIPIWSIEKIIELRVTELFEVVRKKLGAHFVPEKLSGGVILAGGTSKLAKIAACAENVYGIPVHIGDNASMASGELKESQYSTALGLLRYGLQYQSEKSYQTHRQSGIFNRLKSLFQKA
ncbi:cell division protein FtsA [Pelagicoccus sp. SDUM812003]|uniref:cell division protein FtsA n=1 Tax=Pelagicoccus sp. SDUM812003 TaxID=3041267 RepID=UPI00280E81AB|nr:cell division protein FtsA [Pelagicoccus sp. SDUM812003]MDQ8204417.1 cell division protein FtsA [Pelagicoccus sp. SDUM812003]